MSQGIMSYEVGDEIEYEDLGGGRRIARVTERWSDIKNGRSGFDCVGSKGEQWWGYDYMIIRVVRRPQVN